MLVLVVRVTVRVCVCDLVAAPAVAQGNGHGSLSLSLLDEAEGVLEGVRGDMGLGGCQRETRGHQRGVRGGEE